MEITVSQEQGRVPITVFRIKGPVTSNQELEAEAKKAFDAGTKNILIDLTDVPYMATAGLRALHFIYELLRTDALYERDDAVSVGIAAGTFKSPHLKLLKPSPHVLTPLKVAGYDMFLEIHDNRKKAIASF